MKYVIRKPNNEIIAMYTLMDTVIVNVPAILRHVNDRGTSVVTTEIIVLVPYKIITDAPNRRVSINSPDSAEVERNLKYEENRTHNAPEKFFRPDE